MNINVYSFADYNSVRFLAHGLKDNDDTAILRSAQFMAHLVSCIADKNSVLIPIPGRTGVALYTKTLTEVISAITDVPYIDCLKCAPHMTQYLRKYRYGIDSVKLLNFSLTHELPEHIRPILIDNVLDTGTTIMSAACALVRPLDVVVLGNTNHFRRFRYPINLYERSLTLQ